MQCLDRAEFDAVSSDYDGAVAADPAIDRFCSRSAWVLSFHDAFRPRAELLLAREGGAFVALVRAEEPSIGSVVQPLESMWGFASPLVGDGSCELLRRVLEHGVAARSPLMLSGVPLERARLEPLLRMLGTRYALRPLSETLRYQASLDGGVDGWLARRTGRFRRALRTARARTRDSGIVFASESPAGTGAALAAYDRVLAIERHTWKTRSGNGVDRGPMREFYARMLPRLAEGEALRVLFAARDGVDVGYLYGAVEGGLFRGLQFSFREEERRLGLGNALQAEMIERLCAEAVSIYDLGSQSDYKRRWAEAGLATVRLLALPRS